jgi:hypothetical protein
MPGRDCEKCDHHQPDKPPFCGCMPDPVEGADPEIISPVYLTVSDMLRYLYRNVACEYRKGFEDFHKMPNLPGWE